MPELPEVETTRAGVSPHIEVQKVVRVTVRDARLRWPVPDDLAQQVEGEVLRKVVRRGKYLLFEFDQGAIIGHLGMTGSMRIVAHDEPPSFHDHVDLVFEKVTLRYRDPRRFGCLLWQPHPVMEHALLAHLGPEPLSEEFDLAHLLNVCKGKKQAIKSLIMDSKKVVGVGNIYANEALFMAGIHPHRQAGRIAAKRLDLLVGACKQVLAAAIEQGGTTLRNFVDSDGNPGYFKQQLQVYGRAGQACVVCNQPLVESRLGQRSTVYCKLCQR
ncbi:MAG TPA: bifunctional DNA-formamidopyrimidine glycosylase/DNA-(apurinic or apyrimidinic site) lyase [Oceanospirillaceae bacterium]|jgi:formamidopyrimidine-DNA glycosylase|nr:bifunctional DNA-formamidopyrimidine glycosylase/DNA-(apurinic or apyrimidinic site) lyase [Oceanospirillaceae bacterium]